MIVSPGLVRPGGKIGTGGQKSQCTALQWKGHGEFQKIRNGCRGWSTVGSEDKVQGGWWDLAFR